MKIIPAILTSDLTELIELEKQAEEVVDRIQIDIIDHKFADNSTVDPSVLKNIKSNLNLNFKICVDGGITQELIREMDRVGVDEAAVGKRIFEPDLKTNLATFNGKN